MGTVDKLLCISIMDALNIKEDKTKVDRFGEYHRKEDGFHWIFTPEQENDTNLISIDIRDEETLNKRYPNRYITITMKGLNVQEIEGLKRIFNNYLDQKIENGYIIIRQKLMI